MNNTPEGPSSKPSLESLLRLKRAERPDDAFWTDFSIGMRQKQLAAIIEPKPWWLGASLLLRRFSFPAVVATSGAAALLAFTVIRSGSPVTEGGFSVASLLVVEVSGSAAAVESGLVIEPSLSDIPVAVATPAQAIPMSADAPISVLVASLDSGVQEESADLPTELRVVESDTLVASAAKSAVLDNEIIAAAVVLEPVTVPAGVAADEFVNVAWVDGDVAAQGDSFAAASAINPVSYAFDPSVVGSLAGVVAADESLMEPSALAPAPGSRFERLLSADSSKTAVHAGGALAQVRDRVLHHIGREEDLYASVSRLGVGGDRLSLRF